MRGGNKASLRVSFVSVVKNLQDQVQWRMNPRDGWRIALLSPSSERCFMAEALRPTRMHMLPLHTCAKYRNALTAGWSVQMHLHVQCTCFCGDSCYWMVNPILPSLATALLACRSEAAVMQMLKYWLNSDGYNLPFRACYLFKFDITIKNGYLSQSCYFWVGLLCIFWLNTWSSSTPPLESCEHKHPVLSHYLTCTQFICWKITARIIRFLFGFWFLGAVTPISAYAGS